MAEMIVEVHLSDCTFFPQQPVARPIPPFKGGGVGRFLASRRYFFAARGEQ